ncbi:UDP-glucose 4-epimerase [Pseudobythopirellula maris]|uniref:UDP-glucose 4-epimerase n=1 Tax=Pseudobythopirellula maris TaxID=2527991 RepID=A0A5C5ZQR7_9BACT|nr:NAD-dependent epimerase/dehydratase family protein [Pseudobythopirellula maris]TWT89819.1 UDP-glucose 4-epimerase [Pseudobythopirellula maris]
MSGVALVTGGAGFLGSHVAERLVREGRRVIVLDDLSGGYRRNLPSNCEFVRGSVADRVLIERVFAENRIAHVYHLAAYAAEGLSHFVRRFNYENNLLASINLINAAVNHGVKCFVFTSSAAVYGSGADGAASPTPTPVDPYGVAKLAVEQDLRAAEEMFGLRHVVFRPHNVYGERQNLSDPFRNVIGIFLKQTLLGEPCTIFGDGKQTRNFTHVDDVAPAIARCVEAPEAWGKAFDIGSDQATSLNEIAEMVQNAVGCRVGVTRLPERREAAHVKTNHEEARRVFALGPGVELAEGLRRVAAWAADLELGPPRLDLTIEIERELPPSWRNALTKRAPHDS